MITTKENILKVLLENRDEIKGFGARSLGLFGSFARGDEQADSDLDFVVDFEKKSFDLYMDLKAYLEEKFERKVDLVMVESIKPRLRDAILGEAVHAQGL